MASPNQVTGRAKVRWNGVTLDTAGDTTLDPGGVTREAVAGDYEAGAFRVSATRPAKLEISILAKAGFSPTAWGAMENDTLSVEFDNGQSWVMRGAYAEGAPSIPTSDGKIKAVAFSKPAEMVR